MIAEIDEFENYIFSVKLPGSCLKAILERSAACYGEGGLMQVSGLRYAIDLTKPAQVQEVDAQGIATGIITPGERVTSFEILTADGWVAVDPDRQYSVLTSSFIFDKAGDGYFWFKALGTEGRNLYSTLRSILAELAAQNTPLNPREPDGRITVTGLPQD